MKRVQKNQIQNHGRLNRRKMINFSIVVFLTIGVIFPIISMFTRMTATSVRELLNTQQFRLAVVNSLTTALTATIISVALALACAWAIERTHIRLKFLFRIILILPMLIPSISHAFGLVALFGANGILTNLMGLTGTIYGYKGIVIGSVMYSFPVAFLMISSTLQYEDDLPYKAADILGINKFDQCIAITIPYLKKTLLSAFFAVFTMIITDYGVPLMIGGKTLTLSVLMYNKTVGMMDYATGSVIGVILLVPAVVAFVIDIINPDNSTNSFFVDTVVPKKNRVRDGGAYIFLFCLSVFVSLPIIAFCIMAFETKYPVDTTFTLYHIKKNINRGLGTYLGNSVIYAIFTGLIGTIIAFLCAYMTARMKGKFVRLLHMFSMISMAIPGMVLGLSYVIFFSKTPIYGTIAIIVLVNSIHFFSSPYLMMYNVMAKMNENLESVGLCLGVSRFNIIFDVIIPKVKYTFLEMFSYFFVNSMMTISAVSFLAPPSPKPVALMINQFEAQLLMESAAFISLLILAINLIVKGITILVETNLQKLSEKYFKETIKYTELSFDEMKELKSDRKI